MSVKIIDGLTVAGRLKKDLAERIERLKAGLPSFAPGLAVILVGEDPASQVYVRNKGRACEEAGIASFTYRLEASVGERAVLDLIAELNADPQVSGILVQLPLPKGYDERPIIAAIAPEKDVDGFHPLNVGRLTAGLPCLAPCTPRGSMILLREVLEDLSGKRALVIGRSNIVGKPMALMLLAANCTVTLAHSRTLDLAQECRRADILIAALGKPAFVQGDWIKEGAVVIDVGINRVTDPVSGKSRLQGDVDFAPACARAAAITPVPGGVGPMTIACLLQNTFDAALAQSGLRQEGTA